MKLMIKDEKLKVVVQSETNLSIEQITKAYELITNKSSKLHVPDKPETVIPLQKKTAPKIDNLLGEKLQNEPQQNPDLVKADVQCPFCGFTKIVKTLKYNKFIKCPDCKEKLFLSWINNHRGELDENGCYFTATEEFKSRPRYTEDDDYGKNAKSIAEYEEMFKKSDDPNVPDSTNTIAEITKYLDDKGIDHQGVTLKGKLLELVK